MAQFFLAVVPECVEPFFFLQLSGFLPSSNLFFFCVAVVVPVVHTVAAVVIVNVHVTAVVVVVCLFLELQFLELFCFFWFCRRC